MTPFSYLTNWQLCRSFLSLSCKLLSFNCWMHRSCNKWTCDRTLNIFGVGQHIFTDIMFDNWSKKGGYIWFIIFPDSLLVVVLLKTFYLRHYIVFPIINNNIPACIFIEKNPNNFINQFNVRFYQILWVYFRVLWF